MKPLLLASTILIILFFGACNSGPAKKGESKGEKNDSIVVSKTYHSGGGLWKVNRAKKVVIDGETRYVMEGEVLEYYKTPKNALSSKAIYKDGARNGLFIKYYTDGNVFYHINYVKGKRDGIKKSYHKNKQLMAETPYKNGLIGVGTKEYTPDGKLLDPMKLKVWYKKNGNSVTVYAQVLNKGRVTERVQFLEGQLSEGKYAHANLHKMAMKDGVGMVTLHNNPSTVYISAKAKSARNNYSLLTKSIAIH